MIERANYYKLNTKKLLKEYFDKVGIIENILSFEKQENAEEFERELRGLIREVSNKVKKNIIPFFEQFDQKVEVEVISQNIKEYGVDITIIYKTAKIVLRFMNNDKPAFIVLNANGNAFSMQDLDMMNYVYELACIFNEDCL